MIKKEKIFEISKKIGYKVGIYCNDEEIEVFEKFLEDYKYKSNLIEKQKAEIEKKDKMIDLMAEKLKQFDYSQYCEVTNCNYPPCNKEKCIKQYFEKKAEEE